MNDQIARVLADAGAPLSLEELAERLFRNEPRAAGEVALSRAALKRRQRLKGRIVRALEAERVAKTWVGGELRYMVSKVTAV